MIDCPDACPGCAHRGWSAEQSEDQKQAWLEKVLAPWPVSAIQKVAGEYRWHYRRKVSLSTQWQKGRWHFGLWSRDRLIAIPRCPIQHESVGQVIAVLTEVLPPVVDFPMACFVQSGGQAVLVLKISEFSDSSWLTDQVAGKLMSTGLEGLWLNCHPCAGRRLFAKRGWRLLWGKPRSVDGAGLVYGPGAFQQLLPGLYQQSLRRATDFLDPGEGDAVIDLYCGIGVGLRRWQDAGGRCLGVEIDAEAIACAAVNVPEATFLRGGCAQRLPQLRQWSENIPTDKRLLYVNPPRTGLEDAVVRWIIDDYRPCRMAYLSCSAGTLRRDLLWLTEAGYRVVDIIPYDFFPQTYHVEALVLLDFE